MATGAQMRKLALALPEAEERSHFGQPDFRVRGKIFAGVSPDGARGTLKLSPQMQETLLDARAEAFSPCAGAWGRSGWTYVKLAKAKAAELRFLLEQSWRLVAPKKLVTARDAEQAAR